MSIVYNPRSELLREPNLLVPGKKPVGSVVLNPQHWLTPHIERAYISVLSNGIRDLITGDVISGANAETVTVNGNTCLYISSGSADGKTAPIFDPDQSIVIWKTTPTLVENYNLGLQCASDWGEGFKSHSEAGGEGYIGTSIATRFDPTDFSGAFYSVGTTGTYLWRYYLSGATQSHAFYYNKTNLANSSADELNTNNYPKFNLTYGHQLEFLYLINGLPNGSFQQCLDLVNDDPYEVLIPA